MPPVKRLRYLCLFVCLLPAGAATAFFPLQDVKPGMHATGKTVFSGDRIEDFQVEILGVLENIGPKQSLILARLSGGPIEKTGVMQGMSGSPVYIDGKLVGAVAMAFPFSKEAIAGIRPIADMLGVADNPPQKIARRLDDPNLLAALPKRNETVFGGEKMIDIATPVSFGGFTRAAIERFTPQLRALGLEPMQGISGGGSASSRHGRGVEAAARVDDQRATGDRRSQHRRRRHRDSHRRRAHLRLRTPLSFGRIDRPALCALRSADAAAVRQHLVQDLGGERIDGRDFAGSQHRGHRRTRTARFHGAGVDQRRPAERQEGRLQDGNGGRPFPVAVPAADERVFRHRRDRAHDRRGQLPGQGADRVSGRLGAGQAR